jgi:hypothetical protein
VSAPYWLLSGSAPRIGRKGVVRAQGRVILDDTGIFHPLGLTLFWALYGWKYERSRIIAHLDWIARVYSPDYVRILCEVDWEGRSIDPSWPDYQQVLREFVDYAYDQHGIRSQLTLVGGRSADHLFVCQQVLDAMLGRAHKVLLYEMVNEWERLNKATLTQLINMAEYVRVYTPNLVALSTPRKKVGENIGGYEEMITATVQAGANAYVAHLRRSDDDLYWDPVSQGYDMRLFPGPTFNNEPQGLQSSVHAHTQLVQIVADRANSVVCGGEGYCFHVGQGVTGIADPNHGRPENMWEVPNIEPIMRALRGLDLSLPTGIGSWRVVNNLRDEHPLPVEKSNFWPSGLQGYGIYKNYAAISGSRFVVSLLGVRGYDNHDLVFVGRALYRSIINVRDLTSGVISAPLILGRGEPLSLPGRQDTLAAYLIEGVYL